MSTETTVSPDAETQIPAAEATTDPVVETPDTPADHEQTESEDSKALKRMQRRIDKRTADVYRERAEKEQLAQRLAQLEQRLPPAEDEGQITKDQVEKLAEQKAQEITQRQEITKSVDSVLKAGKALPDFDVACNAVNDELPFYDDAGRPTPFLRSVLEFDQPAQLLHHLGKNPDIAAELADLNPVRRIRRLDAIERELTEKAKPKTSSAPKPLEPPKGGSAGSRPLAALDGDDFNKRRREQIAKRAH